MWNTLIFLVKLWHNFAYVRGNGEIWSQLLPSKPIGLACAKNSSPHCRREGLQKMCSCVCCEIWRKWLRGRKFTSVPLSSAREIACSSVLAYRACLRSMPTQIKFPNLTDGICLACMFSVACCIPTWKGWKRRALGKDSRGWVLFRGEGSRSGRRTVSAAWEAAAHCGRDHPEEHKQDSETAKWTSLGSEETGKVWCNPESHWALQNDSYKQGSVSKVTMRRGEICLENCFIFIQSDVITWNFLQLKSWVIYLCFFHIIYPFFSLKAFCLLTLSSYRMRSRQIQIEPLLPFYKSVISGCSLFL